MLECDVVGIDIGKVLIYLKAGIVESFHEADSVGLVHIARTGTSCNEVITCDTKYRNLLHILQWEGAIVVLQKHHAFGCALASDGSMSLQVGLVAEVVTFEARTTNDVLQNATHTGINILDFKFTALHLVDDLLGLLDHTRSHQVVACMNLVGSIALAGPVGYDDATEAPFIAQNGGKQFAIGLGPDTIQTVV